ncbi:MAG: class I SAM-dependent methyltransferase [Gammaproteobacteria bacterium]|nr:MAG: class I SAM-dependent methyltransferase [Gammaproteobacteria bacterium]
MQEAFEDGMLEWLDQCPACGASDGDEYIRAHDMVYGCSSRLWKYSMCEYCGSLYLSPRPSEQYIEKAYASYHTHNSGEGVLGASTKKILSLYLDQGVMAGILWIIVTLIFPIRLYLDAKSRGIKYISQGKVLDYGCGDGVFLSLCNTKKLLAYGTDFDPEAVREARKSGAFVEQGGYEIVKKMSAKEFDLVTISHVIEHVYNLDELLSECYRVLKPGGYLWLETPNPNAKGLRVFKENWRGLEPPRHLVLFSRHVLISKLKKLGFISVKEKYHFFSALYMYLVSIRLQKKSVGICVLVRALFRDIVGLFSNCDSEFITIKCQKKF